MAASLDQSLVAMQHLLGGRGMGTEGKRLAGHKDRVKVLLNDPWLDATADATADAEAMARQRLKSHCYLLRGRVLAG